VIKPGKTQKIETNVGVVLPPGSYGRIAGRSSVSMKGVFVVGVFIKIDFIYEIPFKLCINYIHESIFVGGVVDRNYKGSIGVLMHNSTPEDFKINRYDRIAQLIVEKIVEATGVVVGNITEGQSTDRGTLGFGSSGV